MKSLSIGKRGLPPFFLVVIACVAFVIYSNSFHVPFALDDSHTIQNNEKIRDLSHFSSPAKFLGARAVVNFTFALNYRFGGLDVFGYHLVNILVHCVNGFMVYFLSLAILGRCSTVPREAPAKKKKEVSKASIQRKKSKDKGKRSKKTDEGKAETGNAASLPVYIIALFAALIFVAHPLQTQAVTYIAQRYASLAAFFYLGSILFYIRARTLSGDSNSSLLNSHSLLLFALAFIFGILAFLSKQTAASLPLAVVLVEAICFGGTRREWRTRLLWVVPICGLFAVFVFYAMGLFGGGIGNMLEDISRLSRETKLVSRWGYLCTQFTVLVIYLRLMILPVGQNLDYYYPFKAGFFDGLTPLAFAFLVSLVILAIWKRKDYPLFTFALFWFLITLSVESSIIPISDALFEHRLYLPLFGFALCAAWLPFRFLPKRRGIAVVLCVCIVVALGTATSLRNRVWQDDLTLWTDVLKKSPRNPRAALNLGNALGIRGRYDEALKLYTHILRSNPDNIEVYHNIALVLEKRGDTERAIAIYRQALRIDPGYTPSRANLAKLLMKQDNSEEALSHYREVLRKEPRNAETHQRIGIALLHRGDVDGAYKHLHKAVKLDPKNDEAHNNLGGILETKGDLTGAACRYSEALVIKPDNPEARANLTRVLEKAKDRTLAVRCYREVLKSAPENAGLHMDFGVALSRLDDLEGAIEQFGEAVRMDPANTRAHYNLGLAFSRQGNMDEAVKEYWASLAIEPENYKAHYNLAVIFYSGGDYANAIVHFEKAMQREPRLKPKVSYDIARAYAQEGKVREATQWLRRAVDAGFQDWDRIRTDEDLANIRDTAQYLTIMKAAR